MNTEQKHTLLPCPFCGGKAKEYERFNSNTVTCLVCGVKVRQSEMGQGDASERWNRRAALQSQKPKGNDIMLSGVIRMPFEMAMADPISRMQFYQRAQQALNELEALQHSCKETSQDAEDAEEIATTLATVLHFIPRREEPELYDDIEALCVQFSDHARHLREIGNKYS